MNLLPFLALREKATQTIITTLQEMANLQIHPFESSERESWTHMHPNSTRSFISFQGDVEGRVTIAIKSEMARTIARNMLNLDEKDIDDATLKDVVGELLNMVAGNIKTDLSNSGMESLLTTPEPLNTPWEEPIPSAPGNQNDIEEEVALGDHDSTIWIFLTLKSTEEHS